MRSWGEFEEFHRGGGVEKTLGGMLVLGNAKELIFTGVDAAGTGIEETNVLGGGMRERDTFGEMVSVASGTSFADSGRDWHDS